MQPQLEWELTLRRNATTEYQIELMVAQLVARGVPHFRALEIMVEFLKLEGLVH